MRKIDPHCHCRDGNQAYKSDIRKVSESASSLGMAAIFDMPNTDPPILTEKEALERIELAKKRQPKVKYFFYIGLTAEEKQIKEAIRLVREYPQAVGLKLYCARSGHLGVSRETDQPRVYQILQGEGYEGVVAVHCEKESLLKPHFFDPSCPWTHNLARPPEAEIESVKDQISFTRESRFKGGLHICHISCPESVRLVQSAKRDLKITSGITPHHALLENQGPEITGSQGLLYKVNPPLRDFRKVKEMQKLLLGKRIDWIETDYAPHTLKEKLNPPYLSGIALHSLYQSLIIQLSKQGLSKKDIQDLTFWNIKKTFGEKLEEV